MRILLGTVNIASQLGEMKKSFEELGHEVSIYLNDFPHVNLLGTDYSDIAANHLPTWVQKNLFDGTSSFWLKAVRKPFSDYRKSLIENVTKKNLDKLINDHDLFIFIWDSLLPDYSDLEKIRSAGKKIIFIFCGDDVRWYFASKQEFESLGMHPIEYDSSYFYGKRGLEFRLRRIAYAERYANLIYSKREQAQLQSRPFFHWRMTVDPSEYPVGDFHSRNVPLIVHAPSNQAVKGTKYVMRAIENLKKRNVHINFKLIQNMNAEEVRRILQQADLVIDQLFIPGGGRLTTESLSVGAEVMTYMNYGVYDQGIGYQKQPTCPILDAGIDNIENRLYEFIETFSQASSKAHLNNHYVKEHLDVRKICRQMLNHLEESNPVYEYNPYFYQKSFIPESKAAEKLYRKYLG